MADYPQSVLTVLDEPPPLRLAQMDESIPGGELSSGSEENYVVV